jgi:bidirectional [NiFe] hydrogenase diaphorase subunit
MNRLHVPYRFPRLEVDASHPRFVADHNRCILCGRCIRVCDEVEGAHTWDVAGRGVEARVISDLAQPWGTSETCTSCGKCVQVCPTGALTEKGHAVAKMRKQLRFLPYLKAMREVHR